MSRHVGVLPTAATGSSPHSLTNLPDRRRPSRSLRCRYRGLSRHITKEGTMKRILFLTLAAAFFTSCERPTAPATHDPPALASTAATSTTFSGEATVLQAQVLDLQPIVVGEAGPVPEAGGAEEFSLLSVGRDQTGGLVSAEAVHATVVAQGNSSSAEASLASPDPTGAGHTGPADPLRC